MPVRRGCVLTTVCAGGEEKGMVKMVMTGAYADDGVRGSRGSEQ